MYCFPLSLLKKLVIGNTTAWILGKNILSSNEIPSGIICMWSGLSTNIPTGWVLCNGSQGTPNLQDKFIIGAGNKYSPKNTGGSESVILTTDQLPSHNHKLNGSGTWDIQNIRVEHPDMIPRYRVYTFMNANSLEYGIGSDEGGVLSYIEEDSYGRAQVTGSCSINLNGSSANTGSNQAHDNMPPYFALCFIMKL